MIYSRKTIKYYQVLVFSLIACNSALIGALEEPVDKLLGDMEFANPLTIEKSEDTYRQLVPSGRSKIAHLCQDLSDKLNGMQIEACTNNGLYPSRLTSALGRPLLYAEVKPIFETLGNRRILLVGGQHGDELSSVKLVFNWLSQLNKSPSPNTLWRVLPAANPDGILSTRATRTNANGIDLNRNLPTPNWLTQADKYWEGKGSNERYFPGVKPASEPETQWLMQQIEEFAPDAIISVHAPLGIFDFNSNDLSIAPRTLGPLNLYLLGTFPGSLGNYAGMSRNVPVITIELKHSYEIPDTPETQHMWADLHNWLDNFSTNEALVNN
jgi:murein peptide amidase A